MLTIKTYISTSILKPQTVPTGCSVTSKHWPVCRKSYPQIRTTPSLLRKVASNDVQSTVWYGNDMPVQEANTYSQYSVYKGTSAFKVALVGPSWKYDNAKSFYSVGKPGGFLFEFAQVKDGRAEIRTYSWDQKIKICLRPTEMVAFTHMTNDDHKFYHDKFKGKPNEGTHVTSMKVLQRKDEQYPDTKCMLSVTQTVEGKSKTISIPLSPKEMAVLKSITVYAVPLLYGFQDTLSSSTTAYVTEQDA